LERWGVKRLKFLIFFFSLCYNPDMEPNSQDQYRKPALGDEPQPSSTLWIILILVGLFAVGGFVFNLGRLFNASRPAEPTRLAPPATSAEIEINSTVSLSEESGSFTIWGNPVSRNVICGRGEVYDLVYTDLNPDSELLTDLEVSKQFVCEDGSGSFYLTVDVQITDNRTTGTWQITGGEGNYGTLSGSGALKGTYLSDDLVVDSYSGTVTG